MNALVRVLNLAAHLVPRRMVLSVYSLRPVAETLRVLLNVAVPCGMQEVAVVSGPLCGVRLVLDLKREKYLWLGTYEPWVQEAILRHLRPGMIAWDVGAFIGYHMLLMYRIVGPGGLLALEPDPVNRERLDGNLALNGVQDVVVLPMAAGSAPGKARLVADGPCSRVVSLADGKCRVVRLDDLLERFPSPHLVKVDIEGGEEDALVGAPRLLFEIRPTWVMELHGAAGEATRERLLQAGYQVVGIGKGVDVTSDLSVGGPMHVVALP